MSKKSSSAKINKNIPNNKLSNSKQQYNVIINQNSTFNQDNSINIMLDSGFQYFQNYNLQSNESESSNQIYPFYDYQKIKNQNNINNSNTSKKNIESDIEINNSNNMSKNLNIEKESKSLKEKINKIEISPKKNRSEIPYEETEQGLTNKIDYRHQKKYPMKEIISSFKIEEDENNNNGQLFWFATYDKLMKTKHLLKILNYYNNKPFEQQSNKANNFSNSVLKEKTLIIKDFEIYFCENSNKPFIRYAKGGTIFTKLYLLTLKEISLIFSYINRIEYKIDYDRLNYLQRKGTFEIVNDNTNGIILPYCLIYCLGKYMNINIYSFSNNIDYNINFDEDYEVKGLFHVFLKNFEANHITFEIVDLEMKNITKSFEGKKESTKEEFLDPFINLFLKNMKVTKEEDKKIVISCFDNLINSLKGDTNEFLNHLMKILENLVDYSIVDNDELQMSLAYFLQKYKSELEIRLKEANNNELINFEIFTKIVKDIDLQLDDRLMEYLFYMMKSSVPENHSIFDLNPTIIKECLNMKIPKDFEYQDIDEISNKINDKLTEFNNRMKKEEKDLEMVYGDKVKTFNVNDKEYKCIEKNIFFDVIENYGVTLEEEIKNRIYEFFIVEEPACTSEGKVMMMDFSKLNTLFTTGSISE